MKNIKVNQICCDDTGSDDFFGPLCVVACYIDIDDLPLLQQLHIDELDLHDNDQIIKIAQILKERLNYSLLLLDNSHYNQLVKKGMRLSQIKAILYNRAMINVMKKTKKVADDKIIHSFLSPKKYYRYLRKKLLVVSHLTFSDDYLQYPGLKCAKILSLYAHYQYFRNMNHTLNTTLPHGCNKIANDTGKELIEHYGLDIMNKICKINMPNYQQIITKK